MNTKILKRVYDANAKVHGNKIRFEAWHHAERPINRCVTGPTRFIDV